MGKQKKRRAVGGALVKTDRQMDYGHPQAQSQEKKVLRMDLLWGWGMGLYPSTSL